MAELFDNIFNPQSIYETLFFNVKPVLIYPTLKELEKENKAMFERWKYISKSKYNFDLDVLRFVAGTMTNETPENEENIYLDNAVYYPEFSKIVAITYATLYVEDGMLKRFMKKIVDNDELVVLNTFMDELKQLSSDGMKSTPHYFPTLCGHNILKHDIPLLIKRFVFYRDNFDEKDKNIPHILKHCLTQKPWESGVIDTVNVWKFGGYDNSPLMLISDFLNLKKSVDLLPLPEVSKKYWETIDDNPEEALKFVSLQSAIQTNFVIQIMNELRQL